MDRKENDFFKNNLDKLKFVYTSHELIQKRGKIDHKFLD